MTTKVSLNNDNYRVDSNLGIINIATTLDINTTGTLTLDSEEFIYLEAVESIHLRPEADLYLGNVDYTTISVNTRASGNITTSTTTGNMSLSCNAGIMTFADSTSGGPVTLATLLSGGGGLSVQDEGVEVDDAVTTLNFTGSGVIVTESPAHQINIAIAGGGGSGYWDTIGTNSLYATSAGNTVSGDGNLVAGVANSTTGDYNNIAGAGNNAGAGQHNTVFGETISLVGSDGNCSIGRDFTISNTTNTIFSGRYHVSNTIIGCNIFGNGNDVSNSDYNSVTGNTNTLQYANLNIVGGYDSDITGTATADAEYNICFGNEIDIMSDATVTGSYNVLFGYQNEIDRASYNLSHGSGNSIVYGKYNVLFGINGNITSYGNTNPVEYNLAIGDNLSIENRITTSGTSKYNIISGENLNIDDSIGNFISGTSHIVGFGYYNFINGLSNNITGFDNTSNVKSNIVNGNGMDFTATSGNTTAYSLFIGLEHSVTDSNNNIINGVFSQVNNSDNNIITGGYDASDYHDLDYVERCIIGGTGNDVTGGLSGNTVVDCIIFGSGNIMTTTGTRRPSYNMVFGSANSSTDSNNTFIFGTTNTINGGNNAIFGLGNSDTYNSYFNLTTGRDNDINDASYSFVSGLKSFNQWYATHVNSGGEVRTNETAQIISHAPMMKTTSGGGVYNRMYMDPSGTENFNLRANCSYVYSAYIIGKQRSGVATKGFKIEGVISYDGVSAHTLVSRTKTVLGSTALTTNWDADAFIDFGTSVIYCGVRGDAGQNINWSGSIDLVEVEAN